MTSDRDDLSKVTKHIHEAKVMEIPILAPDVNESGKEFVAAKLGIRFALLGIKGIGEGVVEAILEEREKRGPYRSLYDFVQRNDTRKVGKKTIENLIESGCFDFTGWAREAMLLVLSDMYEEAVREQKEAAKGVLSLFSLIPSSQETRFSTPPVVKEKTPRQQVLKKEHALLGIYLNGHPLDDFSHLMQKLSCVPLKEIESLPFNSVFRIAFIIETAVIKISQRSQRKFAIVTIGDGLERFELPIWPDLYQDKSGLIVENQLLYAVIHKENQDGQMRLQCRWVDDLTQADGAMIAACDQAYEAAKQQAKTLEFKERGRKDKVKDVEMKSKNEQKLKIQLDADVLCLSHILHLKEAFRSHPGNSPIEIAFVSQKGRISSLHIDKTWGVDSKRELETKIAALPSLKEFSWEQL